MYKQHLEAGASTGTQKVVLKIAAEVNGHLPQRKKTTVPKEKLSSKSLIVNVSKTEQNYHFSHL